MKAKQMKAKQKRFDGFQFNQLSGSTINYNYHCKTVILIKNYSHHD